MTELVFQVGDLVLHPKRPEWGPGKIVRVEQETISVVWRDLPGREAKRMNTTVVPFEAAPDPHDDVLDNLPPLVEERGALRLPKERMTFQQAVDAFTAR